MLSINVLHHLSPPHIYHLPHHTSYHIYHLILYHICIIHVAPGKQGRYDGELLLREDQLLSGIWKQKCIKIRKDIKSAFGEDVTSDVGLYINKSQDIRIGLGKQNPNAKKGRERRGKKKKNSSC